MLLWSPRVGSLPQRQGRLGNMGLWKLYNGLLRLKRGWGRGEGGCKVLR